MAVTRPRLSAELHLSPRAKDKRTDNLALQKIAPLIHQIRGERVILDSDLSAIYGVDTRSLVQAVKRKIERFPSDLAFQLSADEYDSLRSQIVISKGRGGRHYLPFGRLSAFIPDSGLSNIELSLGTNYQSTAH